MTEGVGNAGWELAQLNVGRALYPMNSPGMAGFAGALDRINALAEASPGFVWRLQDESGNATGILTSPDPLALVNLSVWASLEALERLRRDGPSADAFGFRTAVPAPVPGPAKDSSAP